MNISEIKSIGLSVIAGIGGVCGWFFGGWDGFLYALLAFVVIDYITGVMRAKANKEVSSEVGFKGICKKMLIFIMVGVGHVLDTQILGAAGVLRTAIIFFYMANEGISLMENASALGLPVPQTLKDVLAQLHDKGDKGNGV